jgi:hypothetical protein
MILLPLPRRPTLLSDEHRSPDIVFAMDATRRDADHGEEYDWFAMEYPRVFRYHLGHAEHRLADIYATYERYHEHFSKEVRGDDSTLESTVFNREIAVLYWNFEDFLSATSCALDIVARILTTGFSSPVPVSFSKFIKKAGGPFRDILVRANDDWVARFKDYRDCFVHYTPINRLPLIGATRYMNGFELRCRLPSNPNKRENVLFRYNRRTELLRYSLHVYRKLRRLDSDVARAIVDLHAAGRFPARTTNLIGVSMRQRAG